jgi:hypothetical protein
LSGLGSVGTDHCRTIDSIRASALDTDSPISELIISESSFSDSSSSSSTTHQLINRTIIIINIINIINQSPSTTFNINIDIMTSSCSVIAQLNQLLNQRN